jgi:hypothetical protein
LNINRCKSRNRGHLKESILGKGESSPAFIIKHSKNLNQKTSNCNVETEDVNNLYSEHYLGNGRYIDMNHNGFCLYYLKVALSINEYI